MDINADCSLPNETDLKSCHPNPQEHDRKKHEGLVVMVVILSFASNILKNEE